MRRRRDKIVLSASDLMRFQGCAHATALDLRLLEGEALLPAADTAGAQLIQAKGDAHEQAFLAGIGRHLAHMLTWGLLGLTKTTSDVGDRTPPGPTATPADILAMFDRNAAATRALLAGLSEEALRETWSLTWQGKVAMTSTREAVVESMILNHLIHHRGQLSVYLRMNDIPVPSIYGPTADEPGI